MLIDQKKGVFALVDCNNFFASCEKLFNPAVSAKPVAVLSNNDGCIIARCDRVKKLGIPMGAPVFKYQKLITDNQVQLFSSNYKLYADMSSRFNHCLSMLCSQVEIYSIDEAFIYIDTSNLSDQFLYSYFQDIYDKIEKWIGIPISIGIAKTKTLAKLASEIAKNQQRSRIFHFNEVCLRSNILARFPAGEIWGIGRKNENKFKLLGINNAMQVRDMDPKLARKVFSVIGERLIYELRGVSCLDIEDIESSKNITASRSFPSDIADIEIIGEAVASFIAKAARKLRRQNLVCSNVGVFLKSNRFKRSNNRGQYYCNSKIVNLDFPTNDNIQLVKLAKKILKEIYNPIYAYKKAGIMLLTTSSINYQNQSLLGANTNDAHSKLFEVIDNINNKYNKELISLLAQGVKNTKKNWASKCDKKSFEYTTNWAEIPIAN